MPSARKACPHCDAAVVGAATRDRGWRRAVVGLASTVGGGAFMLTLMACYGRPHKPCMPADDLDGDKTCGDSRSYPFDCKEGDPTIHPGAVDPVRDGIDQDCDGVDGVRPSGCHDGADPDCDGKDDRAPVGCNDGLDLDCDGSDDQGGPNVRDATKAKPLPAVLAPAP